MPDGVYLDIDITDAKQKMETLRAVLSEREMRQLSYRVLRRTGAKVKSIVSTDVPKKYHIQKGTVASDIRSPRMGNIGAGEISCCIPIEGKRHIIGGKTFPAKGGRHGWKNIKGGKRYKITAQIIKGETSVLPETIKDQGGNPPFRNLGARKLNNATFTRAPGVGFPPDNLPIVRVAGLAVPQMPMNRAEDDVQNDVRNHMMDRIEKEYANIIRRCR